MTRVDADYEDREREYAASFAGSLVGSSIPVEVAEPVEFPSDVIGRALAAGTLHDAVAVPSSCPAPACVACSRTPAPAAYAGPRIEVGTIEVHGDPNSAAASIEQAILDVIDQADRHTFVTGAGPSQPPAPVSWPAAFASPAPDLPPVPPLFMSQDAADRKAMPVATGFAAYFPDAMRCVSFVSKIGNDQHNPGQPLHWAKEKSGDEPDAGMRHALDALAGAPQDPRLARLGKLGHLAQKAWRANAELQRACDAERREYEQALAEWHARNGGNAGEP